MRERREAFTLIELVFTIMIIGVLVGVAIPKLAATRYDVKIASEVDSFKTFITNIGNYYTTKGYFGNWSDMSNINNLSTTNSNSSYYMVVPNQNCVQITKNDTEAKLTLSVNQASYHSGDNICKDFCDRLVDVSILDNIHNDKIYTFGGSLVSH